MITNEARAINLSVTAAQLNAVDTADQTLYTFPTNTGFIRVPTLLHVVRKAGTAYAWTVGEQSGEHWKTEIQDHNRGDQYTLDVCWSQTKANWASARTTDAVFKIPHSLLAQVVETEMVIFPFVDGQNFGVDGKTSLVLRAPRNVTVSGGTGVLVARLYYTDYPVGVVVV